MHLERIETPGIAHYAWLVISDGDAMLVDPQREVDGYLARIAALGARLRFVAETHRHEDFVIGSGTLARRTGARVVTTPHETFGHGDLRLDDGATFGLGALTLRMLHTPGHTPESCCYALFLDEGDEQAYAVFTGDTLFFGDTGRTDLPDADRAEANAARLYDSVHTKLAGLGDACRVLPAHGPGSVCGSGMADRPWSTLAQEKRENPVFTCDRATFAERKGGERLPRPPYFRTMERVNLDGGLAPVPRGTVPRLGVEAFAEAAADAVVIDTRPPEAFAAAHLPGAHSVWMGGLPVFGGWVAEEDQTIALVTQTDGDVDEAVAHLRRIGREGPIVALAGGFPSWRDAGRDLGCASVIRPHDLAEALGTLAVLDVREPDAFAGGHIPGAHHAYVGYLPEALEGMGLDPAAPVVVTCGVGHRASVGTSLLLRAGFTDVRTLLGGMSAWSARDLPMEQGDP